MFGEVPSARADLRPGTLYAVATPEETVFYGQVCPDQSFAFFRVCDTELSDFEPGTSTPVMSRFSVNLPSIGRALRAGVWKKVRNAHLSDDLLQENAYVQWPVGTLNVHVWRGSSTILNTRIEDPAIQNVEVMSVWDADAHVASRLLVDFDYQKALRASESAWSIGGPVWRQRRIREEYARRFPGGSHDLPKDWVPTNIPR
jgi:hypothetical protein